MVFIEALYVEGIDSLVVLLHTLPLLVTSILHLGM